MIDLSPLDYLHIILKDKNPFTVDNDTMEIIYSPLRYNCESENGDYRYTIRFSDKNVENPRQFSTYLAQKIEECNSAPYDTVPLTGLDIMTELGIK